MDGFGISFLSGGETGAVDAIVNVWVDPFVGCLDFFLEVCGVQIDVLVFLRE